MSIALEHSVRVERYFTLTIQACCYRCLPGRCSSLRLFKWWCCCLLWAWACSPHGGPAFPVLATEMFPVFAKCFLLLLFFQSPSKGLQRHQDQCNLCYPPLPVCVRETETDRPFNRPRILKGHSNIWYWDTMLSTKYIFEDHTIKYQVTPPHQNMPEIFFS